MYISTLPILYVVRNRPQASSIRGQGVKDYNQKSNTFKFLYSRSFFLPWPYLVYMMTNELLYLILTTVTVTVTVAYGEC